MLRVYVDLDDVLSKTAVAFTRLLAETNGKQVDLEEITEFDLTVSFEMTQDELDAFMVEAHRPERLLAVEPMDGALEVLEDWAADGHQIDVLTGRPPASADASRAWLDRHGVPHRELFFVDKYTRYDESAWNGHGRVLRLEELHGDRYDVVVEDSLATAAYLAEATSARILLIDKPWNRGVAELSGSTVERLERCADWSEVAEAFPG